MIDINKLDKTFEELKNNGWLEQDLYCYQKEPSDILDTKHLHYSRYYKKVKRINGIIKKIEDNIKSLLPNNILKDDVLNNLVIVGYYIHQRGSIGYKKFCDLILGNLRPTQKEERKIIDRVIGYKAKDKKGKEYRIDTIIIYYKDVDQKPDELKNKFIIAKIRRALFEKFVAKPKKYRLIPLTVFNSNRPVFYNTYQEVEDDFPEFKYEGRYTDPYRNFIKYWVSKIERYIDDKIPDQKERFDFIGNFFDISGMPFVDVISGKKGRKVPKDKFFIRVMDYLK